MFIINVGDIVYSVKSKTDEVLTHTVTSIEDIGKDVGRRQSYWQLGTTVSGRHVTIPLSRAMETFEEALQSLLNIRHSDVLVATDAIRIIENKYNRK